MRDLQTIIEENSGSRAGQTSNRIRHVLAKAMNNGHVRGRPNVRKLSDNWADDAAAAMERRARLNGRSGSKSAH